MRIFVTGGTGFIGKFVIKKLTNQKNEIIVLTRNIRNKESSKDVTFIKGDLENIAHWKKKLIKFKPEATIHLAWEDIPDFSCEKSIKNLKIGLDLIELVSKIGCKVILVAGSVWEYGKQKGKLSEEMHTEPFNAFTAAKNSLRWMGQEIAKENNLALLWTRIFYVYGTGQKNISLIPYVIRCIKNKITPEIRNPNAQNDFVYVEDVAEAIAQLIVNYKQSGLFNIGSGKLTSITDIVNCISKYLKVNIDFKIGKKEQMDSLSSSYADISKIKKTIGWQPKVAIDAGLKKTIEYFIK